MSIDREYPFCNKEDQNTDHLLKPCDLTSTTWSDINIHCPNPNKTNVHLIDWFNIFGYIGTGIIKYFVTH